MRLDDRVALITGGGAGIGRAIAKRFVEEGARLVILDKNPEAASALAKELGDGTRGIAGDVTVASDLDRAFAQLHDLYGQLDILNNAFSVTGDSVVRMDEETWETDVRGTLTSVFMCTPVMADELLVESRKFDV